MSFEPELPTDPKTRREIARGWIVILILLTVAAISRHYFTFMG